MKTAVEWLAEELCYITDSGKYIVDNTDDVTDIINKAIEMEKEQIIEAFAKGSDEESDYHGFQFITEDKAIQYYNETFKTNK